MTSLLLHWLNDELALHRKVSVLERDLCNGYILAEILHVHGLESHLERYTDGNELATRVNNLELLGKAMAAGGLGVLSVATKRDIMMENRSAILQLLLRVKEFLESRGKKLSVEQQKLTNVASRVYEPRSPVKHAGQVVQDVEERFVKETTNKYHPKKVQFHKEINSEVHLRKFPQHQWQRENDQIENETKMKADQAQRGAASMMAVRTHLKDKRTFMQEWDDERLQKWQQTQKMYIEAERNDLRLELTLEERTRRRHAYQHAQIHRDAADGIVGFEKNMNRLGLSGNSTGEAVEPSLRAIASTDPGAVVHLERLEQRVNELGFRPSNNIQMMKELRSRRKAQLAAEKDRRMRRMKAVSDSNKAAMTMEIAELATASEEELSVPNDTNPESADPTTGSINLYDAFIETNRDTLEANYTQLRALGTTKRETDMEELDRLRLEKRTKSYQQSTSVCAAIVEGLIARAILESEHRDIEDPTLWQQQSDDSIHSIVVDGSRHGDTDTATELNELTAKFLTMTNAWGGLVDRGAALPSTCPNLSTRVELFVQGALAAASESVLSTAWQPLDGFKLVALFSSDPRGQTAARLVATNHHLHFVDVDELLDECVRHSYDPVKQADHVASLGVRERDLGAFGPKLTPLRAKNTPIPDALVVDIVVAAVSLSQRKEVIETDEHVNQDDVVCAERVQDHRVGCLLHNFPRSLDEWKLFEKSMLNVRLQNEVDDEIKAARLAALDATATASGDSNEGVAFASCVDAAIIVSFWEPPQQAQSPFEGTLSASPSGTELTASATELRRASVAQPASNVSKRQSVVDPSIALKAEEAAEVSRKSLQVEKLLALTSRMVIIEQAEMDERVLEELIHLAIDVYAAEALQHDTIGAVVECSSSVNLPQPLQSARDRRRSAMAVETRIAWMTASKELVLDERSLVDLVLALRRLEEKLSSSVRQHFRVAQNVLVDVSHTMRSVQLQLDELLMATAADCATALQTATTQLQTNSPTAVDKILIATEVSLGDVVDHYRVLANEYVDNVEAELVPPSLLRIAPWLQLLPLVCLEIKEYIRDTNELLANDFYTCIPFLQSSDQTPRFPLPSLTDALDQVEEAAVVLDHVCAASGLGLSLQAEISRLAGQLATRDRRNPPAQTTTVATTAADSPGSGYELMQQPTAEELTRTALDQLTAILRWSSILVERVMTLHVADVEAMRAYIKCELKRNNNAIASVMKRLIQTRSAQWPLPTIDTTAHPLTRHQQAACLSATQLETLVMAFRAVERSTTHSFQYASLPQEQFVTTLLEVARQHNYPDMWQESTSVARLAMAWACSSSGRVPWRQVLFSLICTQFIGFPSARAIESAFAGQRDTSDARTITRDDFQSQLPLWFEDKCASPSYKSLLFSLFSSDSSPDEAPTLPMLLTWCCAPLAPRDVRVDLATGLLPHYGRGLSRAFTLLSQWTLFAIGTPRVTMGQVSWVLRFAEIEVDDERLRSLAESHGRGHRDFWCPDEMMDFLTFCDAYDPMIAQRFMDHDSFAAPL